MSAPASGFTTAERPGWDLYSRCIHCGLCLNQCPTYRVLGMEADSPRGRLYQVVQVNAGRLTLGDSFVRHMDRCLGCMACENACPSGVQFGAILEGARAEIEAAHRRPWLQRKLRAYFYDRVIDDPKRMLKWARVVRFYQRSGLQTLMRATRVLSLFGLQGLEALTPRIDRDFFYTEIGKVFPAQGNERGRVAMLAGCISNVAFAELNRKTIRVLNANGVTVVVPEGQGCCGALHDHAGKVEDARGMARRNIQMLDRADCDAIISNAAGCGAMMKHYGTLLSRDSVWRDRASVFSAKIRDIHEYLAEIGPAPVAKPLAYTVTYQDSCHLAHAQRVREAPRRLLEHAGARLVEMPHADLCCGSGGVYNVAQHTLSMGVLGEKMGEVAATRADVVATANPGCMLQLRAGVQLRRLRMEVKHVVELLDEAY